jgi:hypothetical protein
MDHSRTLRPVHHDQLKKSSGAISAGKQIPNRIFGDLLDDQCIAHNVLDVFRFDVVPQRRAEDLHSRFRTTKPVTLADLM